MQQHHFVICINNTGFPASLVKRKVYEALPDDDARKLQQLRVIDESGEDYLYPAECFVDANLSSEAQDALLMQPGRNTRD